MAESKSNAPTPSPDTAVASRERVRHLKSDGEYEVLDRKARLQTNKPLGDDAEVVVYRSVSGMTWVRPVAEMNDGRFGTIPAPSSQHSGVEGEGKDGRDPSGSGSHPSGRTPSGSAGYAVSILRADLIAKAEEQVRYWRERQSHETCPDEAVDDDGNYTPIGDDAAIRFGYCNGRYSEADWWLKTLEDAPARGLEPEAGYPAGGQWRPIETAPKDGTDVLLYAAAWDWTWGIQMGRFEQGQWFTAEGSVDENEADFGPDAEVSEDFDPEELTNIGPTHWMPIPRPPSASDERAQREDPEGLSPKDDSPVPKGGAHV